MIAAVILVFVALVVAVVALVMLGRRRAAELADARAEADRVRRGAEARDGYRREREVIRDQVQAETAERLERDPPPAEVRATLARIRRRPR